MTDPYTKFFKGSFNSKVKDPLKVDNYIDDIKNNERRIHFNCGLIIVCVLAAIAAIVVGVLGYNTAHSANSAAVIMASGVLPVTPYTHYLESASIPLSMVLPNDLGGRVGIQYRVWSRSAQPHTVQIAAGSVNPTWDGTSTLATFGGAVGDGFVYEVISTTRIVIVSATNVVFT